jgi:hypothetical protein
MMGYDSTLLHPPPEAAENNYAGPLGVVEWLHKYLQGKEKERRELKGLVDSPHPLTGISSGVRFAECPEISQSINQSGQPAGN